MLAGDRGGGNRHFHPAARTSSTQFGAIRAGRHDRRRARPDSVRIGESALGETTQQPLVRPPSSIAARARLSTRESRCISVTSTQCESATDVSSKDEAPRRSEAG
jgi:hypothetical protein